MVIAVFSVAAPQVASAAPLVVSDTLNEPASVAGEQPSAQFAQGDYCGTGSPSVLAIHDDPFFFDACLSKQRWASLPT